MAKKKSKSPRRRSSRNTKAERGWASAKGALKRSRERAAHLTEGAVMLGTNDVGSRWSGKKQAAMELKGESLTQDIAGRDVDKFIGGGYLAAGLGVWGSGNGLLDAALIGFGMGTAGARRGVVQYAETKAGGLAGLD